MTADEVPSQVGPLVDIAVGQIKGILSPTRYELLLDRIIANVDGAIAQSTVPGSARDRLVAAMAVDIGYAIALLHQRLQAAQQQQRKETLP